MSYHVLRVRQAGRETLCAVQADEVRRSDVSATFWLEGALVYQAPLTALLYQEELADRPQAEARMKELGRRGLRSGALGPEQVAIRPGAGGQRQVGSAVEQVVAVVEGPRVKPRP